MCTRRFPRNCGNTLKFAFGALLVFPLASGHVLGDPYRHSHFLDREEKYLLEWRVNRIAEEVTFNVVVNTNGYVGFGLSKKGKMSGADIVIGGVYKDGRPYFSDRHGVGHQLPIEDISQDWILKSAWENGSHTCLTFSRSFVTCDEQNDLPIGNDVIALIWAYGETDDEIQYHFENRGFFRAYLLDPDYTPQSVYAAHRKNERLNSLGDLKFRKIFPTEMDRSHVHHTILLRCRVPAGQNINEFYEPYLNIPGGTCFIISYSNPVPTQYCTQIVHEYSGAISFFLPDHLGIPVGESPDEYYMYQTHYDNPQMLSNLTISTHLELYYTDKLREHDAGVVFFGGATPGAPSIMLPSHSIDHEIFGHCGSSCTNVMFPPEGVKIFAGKHHTHLAGTGDRFVHVRNNRELPYLLNDDNFIFDYQPVRILREERRVLPGDAIIKRCLYRTTDRNGRATVGGLPTRKEMCTGFFWYYPLITTSIHSFCVSEIRSKEYEEFLGISNTTWSDDRASTVVTAPPENAGLSVEEVGSRIKWTIEKRNQLRNYHKHLPQVTICPDVRPELMIPPGSSTPVGQLPPSVLRALPRTSPVPGVYKSARTNSFRSVYSDKTVVPYRSSKTCWQGLSRKYYLTEFY